MTKVLSAAAMAAMAGTLLLSAPAAQAAEAGTGVASRDALLSQLLDKAEYTARRRQGRRVHRSGRNAAGAAVAIGAMGALIGGAIAAQNRRHYYDEGYGYYDAPAYGYQRGYYGGSGYGYHDPYGDYHRGYYRY